MLQGRADFLLNLPDRAARPGKRQKENTMIFHFTEGEYLAPWSAIIRLDEEADICAGTNTAGAGYDDGDDEGLGDI